MRDTTVHICFKVSPEAHAIFPTLLTILQVTPSILVARRWDRDGWIRTTISNKNESRRVVNKRMRQSKEIRGRKSKEIRGCGFFIYKASRYVGGRRRRAIPALTTKRGEASRCVGVGEGEPWWLRRQDDEGRWAIAASAAKRGESGEGDATLYSNQRITINVNVGGDTCGETSLSCCCCCCCFVVNCNGGR